MYRIRLNLVQLVFFPLIELVAIIFLANWLRDLIVLEWDIEQWIAQALGLGILTVIVVMETHIIYCIIKLYYIITKFVSAEDLEKELKKIKES